MAARIEPQVVWLIGDPVSHSLSPLLHNAAFRRLGLPHLYVPLRLSRRMLGAFLGILPDAHSLGLNVTVPHKEAVGRYLERLSPAAKACGAVNCIRIRGRRLEGFNTDGSGFLTALRREAGFAVRGKHVAVLGAGGAAKGIVQAVLSHGPRSVAVLNRTVSRARALAAGSRAASSQGAVESGRLDGATLQRAARRADLIVQTTSVGLDGKSSLPFPFEDSPRHALVVDIVYRPLETPFLRAARKAGRRTLGGWAMFLHQAAQSFEIWTDQPAPLPLMRRLLLSEVRSR